MPSAKRVCFGLVVTLVLAAAPAWAQDAGIAGVARDASGAVLPGVTVTATSPVLIEQQRVAVTDGEGRFSITQLRPGTLPRDLRADRVQYGRPRRESS